MKIVRYLCQGNTGYGIVDGDRLSLIEGSIYEDFTVGSQTRELKEVKILAPVKPRLVIGIGANYREHLEETGMEMPTEPVVFYKPASSVVGHLENILYPTGCNEVNYAGELAVIIKSQATRVAEKKALDYVLGYTCANDVTAVDYWKGIMPTRAKAWYTFCPLGPFIVTDIDGDNLRLRSRLNGSQMQDNHTSEMIFNISRIISSVTEFMTLEPGDVIITGSSRRGSTTIHQGDTVEVEIDGIGTLRNTVVKEKL